MSRTRRRQTGIPSNYDQRREFFRQRNLEYRLEQQRRKAERTRKRNINMRTRWIDRVVNRNLRDIVVPSTKSNHRIARLIAARTIPGYSPVTFAVSMFKPCKRAKSAERRNVFRKKAIVEKIEKRKPRKIVIGGSIAKRTARRIRSIKCKGK